MSFCGFQSESKMMHVSAAVRLMPTPPARVESKKTKIAEPGRQKRSIAACGGPRRRDDRGAASWGWGGAGSSRATRTPMVARSSGAVLSVACLARVAGDGAVELLVRVVM